MRVQVLDPSAFTPPYDRALCSALARAGAEVELVTSRFLYGPVPEAEGYRVDESFYRLTARRGLGAQGRRAFKAVEHLADLGRWQAGLRRSIRRSEGPEILHHQWHTFPPLDSQLMRAPVPQVMTAHYVLPSSASYPRRLAARAAMRGMDAVIAHTEYGARRLVDDVGLDPDRVHVIPHGAFDYLTRQPRRVRLPAELSEPAAGGPPSERRSPPPPDRPVVLFFGLLRPYKGLDVLLEAFRSVPDAELWIAGNPRMPLEPLHEAARHAASPVRFAPRFLEDAEIPELMRRADVVVLPYLDVEQSGVLYTALAFGKPLVLTSVGGFPEVVRRTGAGRLVPPGDAGSLAATLNELVANRPERKRLSERAAQSAGGYYSWESIAEQTLSLYRSLLR